MSKPSPNDIPALGPGSGIVADAFTSPINENGAAINALTHTMLYIRDPAASLSFYRDYLGMSLLLALNTGIFTVYYLSYPLAGDKTPMDIVRTMPTRSGMLELVYVDPSGDFDRGSSNVPGAENHSSTRGGRFGHLGFVVPDVQQALDLAAASGWSVVKTMAESSGKSMPGLPEHVANGNFDESFAKVFSQVGFVTDPDGYYIELLPAAWKRQDQ